MASNLLSTVPQSSRSDANNLDTLLAKFTPASSVSDWLITTDKIGTNSTVFIAKSETSNIVIKHATNPYSRKAVLREQEKMTVLNKSNLPFFAVPRSLGYLIDESSTPHHHVLSLLPGMNGVVAMEQCSDLHDRLNLIRAFARAVKVIHKSWRPQEFPLLRLEGLDGEFNLDTVPTAREWLRIVMLKVYDSGAGKQDGRGGRGK
ncbi:UNVERIFIED_CONTAM: hypothetical protein HDU68_010491 [Siphonaria sp. JEL0065]|nr:hypothetical protein HDU68_010491 [Siphonaria sp. JEL0065]